MLYLKRHFTILCILIEVWASSSVFAQKKWTIDDILHTERIVSAVLSPDGQSIFYQTGFTADGYYPVKPSKYYVLDIERKKTTELVLPSAVSSPDPNSKVLRWSPDSKYISYFAPSSQQQGRRQVWCVSPLGGTPTPMTEADQQVSDFEWSPDGMYLLYVTDTPVSQEESDYRKKWGVVISPEEKQWARKKIVWVKDVTSGVFSQLTDPIELAGTPKWSYDSHYIAYICNDTDQRPQLFTIPKDSRSQQAKQITHSEEGVRFFSWNPKQKTIAYLTAKRQDADYVNEHEVPPLSASTLWICDTDGGSLRITDNPYPQLTSFSWSRNGDKVVFIAQKPETINRKEYHRYIPLYMYVLSISDGKTHILAEGMDFFRGGENITWSSDDRTIWFVNGEGVGYNLFAAEVETGKVRHITTGKECVNIASFDRDFTQVTFIRQSVNVKPDIYLSSTVRWKPRRMTDINPWVKDFANEHGEIVTYKNEGWDIEALLIKPPGFNPKRKYPLIVVAHGGPNWHKLNEWQPDWEQYPLKAYSAEGYVLFFPNFRGSANYGADFIKTTHHDLGGMDFRDVMKGVDELLSQGYIDENRMGICGWSYGGFLTPTIITKTNRFKAAQFGAGLPSIEGMYASLWTVERILYKAFDGYPWDQGATHLQYSPLYYAHKVTTPTLIQHGDKDPRCPVGGAILFYKALKSHGVPTVLEIYPGMGHSITDPLLYKRILTKNLEWFNKWLKGDTTTSFEK